MFQAASYYEKAVSHDCAKAMYNLALLHKKRRETEKARQLFLECEQTYSAVWSGP